MSAHPEKEFVYMTEAEYLAFERASPDEKREIIKQLGYVGRMLDPEGRHEYIDGQVVAMSGGSRRHSLIGTYTSNAIINALGDRPCEVYNETIQVQISSAGRYVYPDLTVVCGEAEFREQDPEKEYTLLNPQLIVEVLSPSTAGYDRGNKFHHYMTLPSLQEYALVSQDEPLIERFVRQDNDSWVLTVIRGLDAEIRFESINITILLAEVYRKVNFDSQT